MDINPQLIIPIAIPFLFLGALCAFLFNVVRNHINEREEERRYKKAKEDFRKALIEMCDATIGFNKAVANSIDVHVEHVNKGAALMDTIEKSMKEMKDGK